MSGAPVTRRPKRTVLPGEGWTVVRTRRGARLVLGRDVVSEIHAQPSATHSLFDVLAALVDVFGAERATAVLGFAGGGLIAPLRAMGNTGALEAVDLSEEAAAVFREVCGDWVEPIAITHAEAATWLGAQRRRFDFILDDLSIPGPGGMTKPSVTFDTLPELAAHKLLPNGVVAVNLLPEVGRTWQDMFDTLARPWRRTLVVRIDDYMNQIFLGGPGLGTARQVSNALSAALSAIGSRETSMISVRSWS